MNSGAALSMEQARQTATAVFSCIERQDQATGLVALAILSELHHPSRRAAPAYPLLETVRIDADQLKSHIAVRDYFSDYLNPDQEIGEHVERLRATPFELSWPGAPEWQNDAQPRARPRNADQLLDIIRVKEWTDPHDWRESTVSWLVRGGQWAYWNMNVAGRNLMCRVANAGLRHTDAQTVALTLKIGRYLGFQALGRDDGQIDCTVTDVLRSIGELARTEHRGETWTRTTSARFSTALASLLEADVLMDVAWPMTYRVLRKQGFGTDADGWLDSRICVASPVGPSSRPAGWRHRMADGMGL